METRTSMEMESLRIVTLFTLTNSTAWLYLLNNSRALQYNHSQCPLLNCQTTVTSAAISTVTSIEASTPAPTGYSAAVLGGTAAGIASGLIVLGALLFLIIFRRRHPSDSRGNLDRPIGGARTSKATADNAERPSGRLSTV